MHFLKTGFLATLVTAFLLSCTVQAKDLPFKLTVSGPSVDFSTNLALGNVGKGKNKHQIAFKDKSGAAYSLDMKYKALPANRSYPSNLDITLKDAKGNKLGYLFFAINNVAFLKKMGVFGFIVDVDGQPFDIQFNFDEHKKGSFSIAGLEKERLVSDTLIPKKGFQMIRPMMLAKTTGSAENPSKLSQSYALDAHPYEMNYTLINMPKGLVQFQYNLYKKQGENRHLLERVYYNADSLETLREGMFAGKYFDKDYGTFKLVYYPAMGQTAPAK